MRKKIKLKKIEARIKRKKSIRTNVFGTNERPRLSVFKSLNQIYAQIIDDSAGKTLVSASTLEAEVKSALKSCGNKEAAKKVGLLLAKKALKNNVTKVTFDRNGYLYHGRVKALADAAREGGLQF